MEKCNWKSEKCARQGPNLCAPGKCEKFNWNLKKYMAKDRTRTHQVQGLMKRNVSFIAWHANKRSTAHAGLVKRMKANQKYTWAHTQALTRQTLAILADGGAPPSDCLLRLDSGGDSTFFFKNASYHTWIEPSCNVELKYPIHLI